MLVIGLTGGIGSGKSAAAEVFAELGVPVIDSDIIAREVVARNSPTLQSIVAHFGPQYLTQEGSLNRVKMRQDIFSDHSKRKALEQIIHPPIRLATQQRLQQARGPYALIAGNPPGRFGE